MRQIWLLSPDAQGLPGRIAAGTLPVIRVGTWPVGTNQSVWASFTVEHADGTTEGGRVDAVWERNGDENSYWKVTLPGGRLGDRVCYMVWGMAGGSPLPGPMARFAIGPALHLALLWHQHQPLYRDLNHPSPKGSYRQPWVRLHGIRDYYSMAALAAEQSSLHLTINLTPVLLWQLADYLEGGATDRSLELTLTPAERLRGPEREELLGAFFDADWHGQILRYSRYAELFVARSAGQPFRVQDLRDLQMWFNLCWFGPEFRTGDVELVTGETASVRRFVERGSGFTPADIRDMVAEQYKILRAIVPLHRILQERGQLEVSTTPYYHPILPLLADTGKATIDRPGGEHPSRFAHPEDAETQVRLAIQGYEHTFGCRPRGMWPAEGAVSRDILPCFTSRGIHWTASDGGVLARSGRWGYDTTEPDVLCRPYRAETDAGAVAIFFRDAQLSDRIGFTYQAEPDPETAVHAFLAEIKSRFADRLGDGSDHVLTVALDGENAWGGYPEDGRPFLRALYRALATDPDLGTLTFSEYLDGAPARGIRPHPLESLREVHDLFTGSWIDEAGSAPGVDLGTWIGEPEENAAWDLLGTVRDHVATTGIAPETAPEVFRGLYAAEGSDWFWWFGADQESGRDEALDDLFRAHLRNVYSGLGDQAPPDRLRHPLVPGVVTWSFSRPVAAIRPGDRLRIQTNCPGVLSWQTDHGEAGAATLEPAGGAMAGPRRFGLVLGPFDPNASEIRFTFRCSRPPCTGRGPCCELTPRVVRIETDPAPGPTPARPKRQYVRRVSKRGRPSK